MVHDLSAAVIRIVNQLDATTDENVRLREENRALREALREYGRHNEGCNAQWGDRYRCRCGWRDVEREFIGPAANPSQ